MALEPRNFKMTEQWAAEASVIIPSPPPAGRSYRNQNLTPSAVRNGQFYNAVADSADWNELLHEATGLAAMASVFSFIPWSPLESYLGDASWCLGLDGIPYRAKQNSGPGSVSAPGVGPKQPPDTDYWESMAEYIARVLEDGGGGGAGLGSSGLVYPTAFHDFYEQSPPRSWLVRNGGLLVNAAASVPQLWKALQSPKNAWKLKTEEQWQELSAAEPFAGVGGVPFFVLDVNADTIRLPDTRGMYKEEAGFDELGVGGVHGDAIRNIEGWIDWQTNSAWDGGALFNDRSIPDGCRDQVTSRGSHVLRFDASRVVPTASVNRPKAFGILGCVYVGEING